MSGWLTPLAVFALVSSAGSQTLSGSAETTLRPAGDWVVEYADWKCVLNRQLEAEGKRAFFSLTREPVTRTSWVRIAIEGAARRRGDGQAVMFGDGQRRPEGLHYNYFQAEGPYQIREYMLDLDKHSLAEVEQSLRFWTRRHGDIELELTGFQGALGALETCMSELHESFGISEQDIARVATEPEGWAFEFVRFPRDRDNLHIVLLFWVTETGRVSDCRLLQPSNIRSFDERVCDELQERARFEPARNAGGEPIRAPRFENIQMRTAVVTTAQPY